MDSDTFSTSLSPLETDNEFRLASSSLLNTWVFVFGKEMVSPKREHVPFRMFTMVFTSAIYFYRTVRDHQHKATI